ncbi:MAG: hypothetical protein R2709_07995 [Marmoricola sp.]
MVFLIFLPFLTALAYLVFRGPGMAERSIGQQRAAQQAADDYIRSVAGGPAGRDCPGQVVARLRCHQPERVRRSQGQGFGSGQVSRR